MPMRAPHAVRPGPHPVRPELVEGLARTLAGVALACWSFAATAAPPCDSTIADAGPPLTDWPALKSPIAKEPALEARIASIVSGMSLRQKVGQMTQPEIHSITPQQVREFHIGSVLSGGGSWPDKNKHASAADWLKLADAFWSASMVADAKTKIPILWGIDAVHGHNQVYGATLFPHNIGLGAAHDACLVRRIAEATAQQVRVTGQDWSFAPTLAVVRDVRWGRTYEGFSQQPNVVRAYAREAVLGLQSGGLIATAKHFVGDGGTHDGRDQGTTIVSEAELIDTHAQGYFGALGAGVQTVMVSFSSWKNTVGGKEEKLHASKYLITDVLKGKLGFDGLVISDWNGHGQVPGCSNTRCAAALNAGIDMVMVPTDWRAFIASTVELVEKGEVPMARIDDAVTRILRVKLRAGLFEAPKPSLRRGAGDAAALEHRELAREAVRRSLVLLKNNANVLPLARGKKLLVVGKSADSIANQTGGWSLTWQGTDNKNADFPNATSLLAAIRQAAGAANVSYSASAEDVQAKDFDAVVAVIGETPYAEFEGDLRNAMTIEHSRRHRADLAVLDKVAGQGVPVVTVLLSGRPLYVNKEINRSDAFVAAWLPGTEGQGVADLLFGRADGAIDKDFSGRLPFAWPGHACQHVLKPGEAPLFAIGYGLRYGVAQKVDRLDEALAPRGGCDASG